MTNGQNKQTSHLNGSNPHTTVNGNDPKTHLSLKDHSFMARTPQSLDRDSQVSSTPELLQSHEQPKKLSPSERKGRRDEGKFEHTCGAFVAGIWPAVHSGS
jgi:hypothetical protein